MKIQKLEIHGFKSFADRTALAFGSGITGVVGPNGCGKSNIVDAIRWCMGEMSAKHLRGRAMQDVIFAGSDSRGPQGFAEVTLTMKNDGNAPPQYSAYEEIALTRRLHRDGTSEYLVNRAPARLKDITDLFLGTGVGTRAYSIIEQGRIGFIVNSRPEDRRSLIEEVAGITKFKARKRSAERRMQATEQNLLRVNDIVAELERQLSSLRRQAKKAERYKRVKVELKDLDLHAATFKYLELRGKEQMQRAEGEKLESRLAQGQTALATDEASLEADRLRLVEEEERLRAEQKAAAEIDAKLAALERDLEHWRTQREETLGRIERAESEVEELGEKLREAEAEQKILEGSVADLEALSAGESSEVDSASGLVAALTQEIERLDAELEQMRQDAVEHVHGAAQQRTVVSSLAAQRDDLGARIERATAERTDVVTQLEAAVATRAQLDQKRTASEAELTDWRNRLASNKEQLDRIMTRLHESDAEVIRLRSELTERRSRLESLREIARRFEDSSDGVRSLMEPAEGERAVGLRSLVADVIEVAPEYETAIEAALGEKLQFLVVESQRAGVDAIAYLKEHAGGRSGFIPLAPREAAPAPAPAGQPGLVGPALACVTVAPEYGPVAEYLLGDVVVVDSIDAGLRIWNANGHRKTLVSLDGDVLDPGGALSGGASEGAGLLAKRREIRELTERVAQLESELDLAEGQHDQIDQQRLQLEVNIQQLDKEIRAGEIELVEVLKDLESTTMDVTRLSDRDEILGLEIEGHRESLERVVLESSQASTAAEAAESGKAQAEGRIESLRRRRTQAAEDLAERTNELTTLRVEVAAREEKLAAARTAIERLQKAREDYTARVTRDRETITAGRAALDELAAQIDKGSELAADTAQQAAERHRSLDEARRIYEEDRNSQEGANQGLREQRHTNELVQSSLMDLKMDLQRIELERQKLVEQIAERHDEVLERVMGDFHMRPAPGPEEEARRAQLEKSLKNIGPINLTAIDECAEVETRYEFLAKQRDDLSAALDSLKRAIRRINKASRERFREAFDAVNEMFQKMYPRLFRGGEAHLALTEAEDILDAGVEIFAQPPGKKLQSVTLMSGGEKALTATALVFAIFLVKPSPFCILDEVDAPLDDANVGRFNDMLREIAKISQFIVITHNKTTMGQADRLYGITMEEPGMSKVVSVDLERGGAERAA